MANESEGSVAPPRSPLTEAELAEWLQSHASAVNGRARITDPHAVISVADADLLALTRDHLPSLISEVRRLRSERKSLRGALARIIDIADEDDEFEARLERITSEAADELEAETAREGEDRPPNSSEPEGKPGK